MSVISFKEARPAEGLAEARLQSPNALKQRNESKNLDSGKTHSKWADFVNTASAVVPEEKENLFEMSRWETRGNVASDTAREPESVSITFRG